MTTDSEKDLTERCADVLVGPWGGKPLDCSPQVCSDKRREQKVPKLPSCEPARDQRWQRRVTVPQTQHNIALVLTWSDCQIRDNTGALMVCQLSRLVDEMIMLFFALRSSALSHSNSDARRRFSPQGRVGAKDSDLPACLFGRTETIRWGVSSWVSLLISS